MKKRMVPIVMAVVMALSLTACGKEKTVSLSEVSETSVSSVEDKEEAIEKEAPAKEEVVTEASVETVAETSTISTELRLHWLKVLFLLTTICWVFLIILRWRIFQILTVSCPN